MRIALGLEYDGATFCGWQTQPSGCGVQDAVEAALAGSDGFNALFMAFVLQSVAMNQKAAWKGVFRIVGWLDLQIPARPID